MVFLVVLAAGCGAGWRQTELLPGPLRPRQQVQVWMGGRMERWQSVVVKADSLSGVPFIRSPECDSCRRTVARSAVDSVRLGDPVRGFLKTVALGMAVPVALLVVWCGGSGCPAGD